MIKFIFVFDENNLQQYLPVVISNTSDRAVTSILDSMRNMQLQDLFTKLPKRSHQIMIERYGPHWYCFIYNKHCVIFFYKTQKQHSIPKDIIELYASALNQPVDKFQFTIDRTFSQRQYLRQMDKKYDTKLLEDQENKPKSVAEQKGGDLNQEIQFDEQPDQEFEIKKKISYNNIVNIDYLKNQFMNNQQKTYFIHDKRIDERYTLYQAINKLQQIIIPKSENYEYHYNNQNILIVGEHITPSQVITSQTLNQLWTDSQLEQGIFLEPRIQDFESKSANVELKTYQQVNQEDKLIESFFFKENEVQFNEFYVYIYQNQYRVYLKDMQRYQSAFQYFQSQFPYIVQTELIDDQKITLKIKSLNEIMNQENSMLYELKQYQDVLMDKYISEHISPDSISTPRVENIAYKTKIRFYLTKKVQTKDQSGEENESRENIIDIDKIPLMQLYYIIFNNFVIDDTFHNIQIRRDGEVFSKQKASQPLSHIDKQMVYDIRIFGIFENVEFYVNVSQEKLYLGMQHMQKQAINMQQSRYISQSVIKLLQQKINIEFDENLIMIQIGIYSRQLIQLDCNFMIYETKVLKELKADRYATKLQSASFFIYFFNLIRLFSQYFMIITKQQRQYIGYINVDDFLNQKVIQKQIRMLYKKTELNQQQIVQLVSDFNGINKQQVEAILKKLIAFKQLQKKQTHTLPIEMILGKLKTLGSTIEMRYIGGVLNFKIYQVKNIHQFYKIPLFLQSIYQISIQNYIDKRWANETTQLQKYYRLALNKNVIIEHSEPITEDIVSNDQIQQSLHKRIRDKPKLFQGQTKAGHVNWSQQCQNSGTKIRQPEIYYTLEQIKTQGYTNFDAELQTYYKVKNGERYYAIKKIVNDYQTYYLVCDESKNGEFKYIGFITKTNKDACPVCCFKINQLKKGQNSDQRKNMVRCIKKLAQIPEGQSSQKNEEEPPPEIIQQGNKKQIYLYIQKFQNIIGENSLSRLPILLDHLLNKDKKIVTKNNFLRQSDGYMFCTQISDVGAPKEFQRPAYNLIAQMLYCTKITFENFQKRMKTIIEDKKIISQYLNKIRNNFASPDLFIDYICKQPFDQQYMFVENVFCRKGIFVPKGIQLFIFETFEFESNNYVYTRDLQLINKGAKINSMLLSPSYGSEMDHVLLIKRDQLLYPIFGMTFSRDKKNIIYRKRYMFSKPDANPVYDFYRYCYPPHDIQLFTYKEIEHFIMKPQAVDQTDTKYIQDDDGSITYIVHHGLVLPCFPSDFHDIPVARITKLQQLGQVIKPEQETLELITKFNKAENLKINMLNYYVIISHSEKGVESEKTFIEITYEVQNKNGGNLKSIVFRLPFKKQGTFKMKNMAINQQDIKMYISNKAYDNYMTLKVANEVFEIIKINMLYLLRQRKDLRELFMDIMNIDKFQTKYETFKLFSCKLLLPKMYSDVKRSIIQNIDKQFTKILERIDKIDIQLSRIDNKFDINKYFELQYRYPCSGSNKKIPYCHQDDQKPSPNKLGQIIMSELVAAICINKTLNLIYQEYDPKDFQLQTNIVSQMGKFKEQQDSIIFSLSQYKDVQRKRDIEQAKEYIEDQRFGPSMKLYSDDQSAKDQKIVLQSCLVRPTIIKIKQYYANKTQTDILKIISNSRIMTVLLYNAQQQFIQKVMDIFGNNVALFALIEKYGLKYEQVIVLMEQLFEENVSMKNNYVFVHQILQFCCIFFCEVMGIKAVFYLQIAPVYVNEALIYFQRNPHFNVAQENSVLKIELKKQYVEQTIIQQLIRIEHDTKGEMVFVSQI